MPNPTKRVNQSLLLTAFVLSFHLACHGAPVRLVDQGVSDYRIYSSPSALASELYAAEVLQDYLARISGCTLPIVHEASADGKLVYVGFADVPTSVLGDVNPETFGRGRVRHTAIGRCASHCGGGTPGHAVRRDWPAA